jgi:hypothetical protein
MARAVPDQYYAKVEQQSPQLGDADQCPARPMVLAMGAGDGQAGGSLRDVQLLAGHRSIVTTQRYIDGDTDVQRAARLAVMNVSRHNGSVSGGPL